MQCGYMVTADEQCGEDVHIAHLVRVHDAPLQPDSDTRDAVLLLCTGHDWTGPSTPA